MNFHQVLEDHTAGDPMRPEVKWTNLSRRQIAHRIGKLGTPVSRHVVSQLLPGQRPDVHCTKIGCTGEGVYNGTINGVPVTTLMQQTMAAGCIPRHGP